MSDLDRYPAPVSRTLAELAIHPEGLRWARDCGWVPGSGYCRNHPCGEACLFRAQRAAEAAKIVQSRRQRRASRRRAAGRLQPLVPLLLAFCGGVALA